MRFWGVYILPSSGQIPLNAGEKWDKALVVMCVG